ncbi:hypothetical protein K469DRAFT_633473 [Zopfia rhizophila CBS 207.26]|uniref:Spindle pole body-associated protein cut12 domain-containing protein n=1 Tax=Zopfia rhizophila CBS 207.26 TaxID=1314779 RepID=A0A6A6DYG7_9PEZI|nr:hypothetical protein K469DRAFT_633473 [Zopfia rhizophila CBS 207.26]
MFSWITGPRITNAIEDLDPDTAFDTTFVEPPETPAPTFAVRAFKQAIFGTPAPEESNETAKKLVKRVKLDEVNSKATEFPAQKENDPPSSPTKPNGILVTPGTGTKGKKTVSFGAHVVDNEGKRSTYTGKSGIPNDCPGKFPSPWAPGTELKESAEKDKDKDKMPRTKLTAALYDARSSSQLQPGQKPKAKDDSDITIDLSAPRSESGKYWKEQYESYADKSEKEVKKLVAKQQVAKNFAKKKDGEATELATRLAEERKRFRMRERELEDQSKDYQERLRQAMTENLRAGMEIAALKTRIASLEKSFTLPSDVQDSKNSFQIYEDSSKDSIRLHSVQGGPSAATTTTRTEDVMAPPSIILGKPVSSTREAPENKDNSPPKSRRQRRMTIPDPLSRGTSPYSATSNLGTESAQASSLPTKSPLSSIRPAEPPTKPSQPTHHFKLPIKSPFSLRQPHPSKENIPRKSPADLQSSPLPQPSSDTWMQDFNESPLPQMDKMALPIASGPSYSKPTKSTSQAKPARHQSSKSISHSTKVDVSKGAIVTQPVDSKFDVSKSAAHHAEGSSMVVRDRVQLPVDRKEQARRRLEQRKAKRLGS